MDAKTAMIHALYCKGDRLCLAILWGLLLLGFALAPWNGTWAVALLVGIPAALVPTLLHGMLPGARLTRCAVAAAFMIFAAQLIQQGHGMIELHFSIFCLLAVLIVYRDWLAIVVAAAVIAVHHLAFNALQAAGQPVWVFAARTGIDLVLIHAAFVVFEAAVLVFVAIGAHREAEQAAETQAAGGLLLVQDGRIDLHTDSIGASSEFGRRFEEYLGFLRRIIGEVGVRAGAIHHAAREIAGGNSDLSMRTEQQASSLAQTSASMQQMLDTVQRNAESARHARELAQSARGEASSGGEVAAEAIAAMSEISASSRRIGDIIGVIDEIAFQTNLLALNAAVEAARAGEAGRGFAVVATEVRNLAQRSATAAREIKTLIEDSAGKVRAGSELVDRTGAALGSIAQGVGKVTDLVSEIAQASELQARGIAEVNTAVVHMDEMTQQNAALVEQAAAAAKELEAQAEGLAGAMESFVLGDVAAPAAQASVRAPARVPPSVAPVRARPALPALRAR